MLSNLPMQVVLENGPLNGYLSIYSIDIVVIDLTKLDMCFIKSVS